MRGDIVEIFPAYEDTSALRIEFFDETIEAIHEVLDPLRGKVQRRVDKAAIYPASHYVTGEDRMKQAILGIRMELKGRLAELRNERKLLQRSDSSNGRFTISSCWRRWASVRGSKTIRAILPAEIR